MTMLSTAETVTRPASAALGEWLPSGRPAATGARADALVAEQQQLTIEIARLVGQMDDATLDADALDAMTHRIAELLARAEQLRLAQMLTARAASDTWLASIDLD